jgi:hypothetical protein
MPVRDCFHLVVPVVLLVALLAFVLLHLRKK